MSKKRTAAQITKGPLNDHPQKGVKVNKIGVPVKSLLSRPAFATIDTNSPIIGPRQPQAFSAESSKLKSSGKKFAHNQKPSTHVKEHHKSRASLASLNKTMIIKVSHSRRETALLEHRNSGSNEDGERSQRSASVDICLSAPFSLAESPLRGEDYDSAHASIADWLDEFNQGGPGTATGFSHLDGQVTPEMEFSELQAAVAFKLPEMKDASVIDALNLAFCDSTMVNP